LVIFDVVEHLPEPDRFFTEAARVLKPGGLLLITTPNIASFGNSVKDLESKTNKPAMYTDPTHCSLLDVQSWHKKLHASGFSIIRNQTDHLWDIPYSEKIPLFLQKVFLLPFNRITARFFGGYSWTKGENLILVARRKT
jgi:SAM-dependent methyltransferase